MNTDPLQKDDSLRAEPQEVIYDALLERIHEPDLLLETFEEYALGERMHARKKARKKEVA